MKAIPMPGIARNARRCSSSGIIALANSACRDSSNARSWPCANTTPIRRSALAPNAGISIRWAIAGIRQKIRPRNAPRARSGDAGGIMQNEPILNYNFPLDAVASEGNWHQANRYSVWVGRQTATDPPYEVIERHPQGAVRLPLKSRLMRLIPAGTPFRVTHLFAPYRASDADMIYIRAAMEEGVYHTLLAATSNEVKQDLVLWFCPHCGHEMGREAFDTRRQGLI